MYDVNNKQIDDGSIVKLLEHHEFDGADTSLHLVVGRIYLVESVLDDYDICCDCAFSDGECSGNCGTYNAISIDGTWYDPGCFVLVDEGSPDYLLYEKIMKGEVCSYQFINKV